MAAVWEYDRFYAFMRPYVDWTARLCFRSVRIEGRDRIPADGAILFAPNHCAAMMDPLLVLQLHKGSVAFGARSDIFANPLMAKVLRFLRIVPIARERNGMSEVAKNFAVIDEIVECLGHGVPFCLFSEGTHRPERGMMPVKKGIFRIARKAADELDVPVRIVPVGIDYEDFFQGQRRMCIRVGEPIDIGAYVAQRPEATDAEIYSSLCKELRERILALIGRIPERRHDRIGRRILLLVLSLPLFLLCGVLSCLIWIPDLILTAIQEDKAWAYTTHFGCRFLLPVLWPFHTVFERLRNDYCDLIDDLKTR